MLDKNPMITHVSIAAVQLGTQGFKNLMEHFY